ncbi:chorismate mutase [Yinghuangia sp. ASG 101]|uniref:chorismate mutase n=1 Tax=Yinghuangia sp. ASG 101 TaxID=2896848 RepID=UPI001E60D623|nr:chorismate mutase [Yinghuangia sp. ASG 101]UGQ14560.1 chorismate mutase [Yinghuangia sp. ASG 101]
MTENTRQAASADETIAATRARIDEVDRRIIELVAERVALSQEVQRTRIAAGGRRVQLTREMEVIGRYREAWGTPGREVAMALLELGRGRV